MLFTFPSRYWFTIGLSGVFSLSGWCRWIQAGFLRSRPTQDTTRARELACTGLSPSLVCLPRHLHFTRWSHGVVLQPRSCRDRAGLGCSAFARHYLRNHSCFLFLRVLRCFSSPGLPPFGYLVFNQLGCPIRTSADQWVCAPPRSLSQLVASFIASESLGIPRAPFSASSAGPTSVGRPASLAPGLYSR